MSNVLKSISLDGFNKKVVEYLAGENITFTPDASDPTKITIAADGADLTDYYTKTEVDDLIEAINEFNVVVANSLPASGDERTIYLIPKNPPGESGNVRNEYMWINNAWELIGDTAVDLTNYYTKTETDTLLDEKQDTLTAGTNIQIAQDGTISATDTTYDPATQSTAGLMSAADKAKLDGIEAGAEANVQSDWNQTDTTADDYIKNKPTNATQSADGFMSSADKTKLDGIETGAEANVQSDWNQTDSSADDFIKNKPGVATQSTDGLMSSTDKTKLDGITWTKAGILALLGYEEVNLTMTDTDGNTISKTILAEIDE